MLLQGRLLLQSGGVAAILQGQGRSICRLSLQIRHTCLPVIQVPSCALPGIETGNLHNCLAGGGEAESIFHRGLL